MKQEGSRVLRSIRPTSLNGWIRSTLSAPIPLSRTTSSPTFDLAEGRLRVPSTNSPRHQPADSKGGPSAPLSERLPAKIHLKDQPTYVNCSQLPSEATISELKGRGVSFLWQRPILGGGSWSQADLQACLGSVATDAVPAPGLGPVGAIADAAPTLTGRLSENHAGEVAEAVEVVDALSLLGLEPEQFLTMMVSAQPSGLENQQPKQSLSDGLLDRRVLLLPILPGLYSATEWRRMVSRLETSVYASVVPVVVPFDASVLRRWLDFQRAAFAEMQPEIDRQDAVAERRQLNLFQAAAAGQWEGVGSELRLIAVKELARKGQRWWFAPPLIAAESKSRNRWISACLWLTADAAAMSQKPIGMIEGYRQAARRIETFENDLRLVLRDGNLKVLDWLDTRVQETLTTWHEGDSGLREEPPILHRLRVEVMAHSGT